MKIETRYFGEMELDESSVLQFAHGIPGFPEEKKFVLLNIPDNPAFQILQSVQNKNLAFVVTNPHLFYKDYAFDLDDGTVAQLDIQKPEDVAVYGILTLQEPFEQSTINLQAPVVIHTKNRQAKQVVLNTKDYHTRHPITTIKRQGEKAHASAHKKSK